MVDISLSVYICARFMHYALSALIAVERPSLNGARFAWLAKDQPDFWLTQWKLLEYSNDKTYRDWAFNVRWASEHTNTHREGEIEG